MDHCNGLLLCRETTDDHDYVSNPATRQWARLPPRPTSQMGDAFDPIKCLVYDPTVSPHYKVLLIPSLPDEPKSMLDSEMMRSEWPPSSYTMQVFSSRTGCWEERSFVLEGGHWKEGRMVQTIPDMKVYWRGALYVACKIGFVLR